MTRILPCGCPFSEATGIIPTRRSDDVSPPVAAGKPAPSGGDSAEAPQGSRSPVELTQTAGSAGATCGGPQRTGGLVNTLARLLHVFAGQSDAVIEADVKIANLLLDEGWPAPKTLTAIQVRQIGILNAKNDRS